MKAQALRDAGEIYLDLKRLELAPAMTQQIADALASGQFVNFGTGGEGGRSAVATGSDDVMRVVQTLMAAQVINGQPSRAARTMSMEPIETAGALLDGGRRS